ncbi:hypothetical protein E4K67_24670 [Desulfosporosinus fructosivorans]|uniref:Uncharacterized protein n=1 Tax=Desulfosporosinus fructosivorans TaxID=2018669 RepID=A0A4Z0R1L5_9FIRM|nr:hypothetical protein [Desulfosporosinus fructosivorans]TGE35516.1 hypothetical protein E4K67_24670 [Desulfosporosinus fructosivorans]
MEFVTCTGITANEADSQPLGYLTEAYRQQVTLNLPLREVVQIDQAYAGGLCGLCGLCGRSSQYFLSVNLLSLHLASSVIYLSI